MNTLFIKLYVYKYIHMIFVKVLRSKGAPLIKFLAPSLFINLMLYSYWACMVYSHWLTNQICA